MWQKLFGDLFSSGFWSTVFPHLCCLAVNNAIKISNAGVTSFPKLIKLHFLFQAQKEWPLEKGGVFWLRRKC